MSYEHLQRRLDDDEVIILDGAIGTELERLGAPMHQEAWCAAALDSHPELVNTVHQSYIDAGADVITSNTYASTRMALESGGLGHRMRDWNEFAVRLARDCVNSTAGSHPVCVAGSVSTFGLFRDTPIDEPVVRKAFREQAEILAAAGVDLLLIETLAAEPATILMAIEACAGLDVPVWVAISALIDPGSGRIMLGIHESIEHSTRVRVHEPLSDTVDRLTDAGVSTLLLMHSDLKATAPAVDVMAAHHRGTLGVYPNAGHWLRPEWAFVDQVSPEEFVAEASRWHESGARILGGCCGIGPEHIRALDSRFR